MVKDELKRNIDKHVCMQSREYFKLVNKQEKKIFEPARTRTWNLLIRSQTRYPLRHRPLQSLYNNS
jgi:hypothetical protein